MQIISFKVLKGEIFVFTGKMFSIVRKDAIKEIERRGGKCEENVTKRTTYLVVGQENNEQVSGSKSTKLRKAEKYIEEGIPIIILNEEEFLSRLAPLTTYGNLMIIDK
jgi:DNA polymerase-3 subunit epsilon